MNTNVETVLVTRNEQGEPVAVYINEGPKPLPYKIESLGMDGVKDLLNQQI